MKIIAGIFCLLVIVGVVSWFNGYIRQEDIVSFLGVSATPTPGATPTPDPVMAQIAHMSTEEKIGQLLMVGVDGESSTPDLQNFLGKNHIRAVLLFKKNIRTSEQLRAFTADLGRLVDTPSDFIIAIDEEGGQVVRIPWEHETVGQPAIIEPTQAYKVAKKRGEELRMLGINMNLSPVIEYAGMPDAFIVKNKRAFAVSDDILHAQLARAMIEGYIDAGILSVPKHFPLGLGQSTTDPHKDLPIISLGRDDMEKETAGIVPFLSEAGSVMVAHLVYPAIASDPASLSSVIIGDILRRDNHFDGVVISDDINMNSLGSYSLENILRKGLAAGVDMFIIAGPQQKEIDAIATLKKLVEEGVLTQERLDQSVARILFLKQRLAKHS